MLHLLFPKHCETTKERWSYLSQTWSSLLRPHPEICYLSHKESKHFAVRFEKRSQTPLEGIIIWFDYTDAIRKLIIKLKLKGTYTIAQDLAKKLSLNIQLHPTYNQDLAITYVPTHRYKKRRKKWYNQSKLLAEHIAQELSLPLLSLSKKNRHTRSQLSLSRNERQKNVIWTFSPYQKTWFSNRTLIIIDDVMTTWSTLTELAKTLKKQYPDCHIRWAVLARNMSS